MPPEPARVIDSLYEAYNHHDPDAAAELYAPDGRHFEIAQGNVSEGRQAVRDGLARFFEAFPDARWQPHTRVLDQTSGAVTYTLTGTLRSRLGPFMPKGQRLELRGVHVLRLSSAGLIEASEDYWDAGTFGRQMSSGEG